VTYFYNLGPLYISEMGKAREFKFGISKTVTRYDVGSIEVE